MSASVFAEAAASRTVLVSETGVERLQLIGRVGTAVFLAGGEHDKKNEGLPSGPNPYELLSGSLAACTAMTIRLYADRKEIALERVQVAVAFHRGADDAKDVYERRVFLEGFLDDEQRARLMQIADRCPVGVTLGKCAEIRNFVELSSDAFPVMTTAPSNYFEDVPYAWWEDYEVHPRA